MGLLAVAVISANANSPILVIPLYDFTISFRIIGICRYFSSYNLSVNFYQRLDGITFLAQPGA
jgi:hypothetical protein